MDHPPDRRRYARTPRLACSAIVAVRSRYAGVFVVENLSAGGALLIGAHRFASGDSVEVLLQLGATLKATLTAKVVRADSRLKTNQLLAVEFAGLPASLRGILNEIVLSTLDPAESGRVALVVHTDAKVLAEIGRDLAALGRAIAAFGGEDEASRWLEAAGRPVAAVLVDGASAPGSALLDLARRQVEGARRVALIDASASELAFEPIVTEGIAQAVLRRPWNLMTLAGALNARSVPALIAQ
jgi:hypothetical protein